MSEHTPLTEACNWVEYALTGGLITDEGTRAAIQIVLDAARTSTATADTDPERGHFPTTPVQCSCGWRETDPGAGTWADHFAATADTGLRERVEALADRLEGEAHRYEQAEPVHWRALIEATRDHAKRLREIVPIDRAADACPSAVRCPDRALCPPACQEAGSRENPTQRPTRHPLDASPASTEEADR